MGWRVESWVQDPMGAYVTCLSKKDTKVTGLSEITFGCQLAFS